MRTRHQRRAGIKGLYGIADAHAFDGDPVRLAGLYLQAGCQLIQLRCKGWSDADALLAAREIRRLSDQWLFIVNDRPIVAVESDADGVHMGQTDAPTRAVRAHLGPHRLIGRSTNAIEHIDSTEKGADYLAFGPVFHTGNVSRPKQVVGLKRLALARSLTQLPLVAIGGITPETIDDIIATGSDGWAVIGAVAKAPDPIIAARHLTRAPRPTQGR